jgi:hypothetical protein
VLLLQHTKTEIESQSNVDRSSELRCLANSGDGRVGTTLLGPLLDINSSNFLLVYNYLVVLLFLFVSIEKLRER